MVRKINDILKDANMALCLEELIAFWNEIADSKKKYSIDEIWKANKHLRDLALKVEIKGQDFDKSKFYWHLKLQCND